MSYDDPNAVVSTDWLARHVARAPVRVLDASFYLPEHGRDAIAEFKQARVPGSRFFDIDEVCDRSNPLPHMMPGAAQFAEQVSALGIANDDQVVVYDGMGLMSAARVWWMFRAFGHDKVAVLDGGFPRWRAEKRPVERGWPTVAPRSFTAKLNPVMVRSLDDIRANLDSRREQVVDARAAGRFDGAVPEPRPGLRSGHIPASRNLPYYRLLDDETRCLRDPAQLRALFESAGIDLARPVVTTCGSGVSAAVLSLGLYLLGHAKNALYDGSWTEWGGHSETAVET